MHQHLYSTVPTPGRQLVANTFRFLLCRCLWTVTEPPKTRDVIYFLKAMTNSFETLIYFCKVYPAIWENKKTRKNYKKKKNKQSNPQLEPTNCCFSKKSFTFQKSIPAFVWSAPKCVMINTLHYDNKYFLN